MSDTTIRSCKRKPDSGRRIFDFLLDKGTLFPYNHAVAYRGMV